MPWKAVKKNSSRISYIFWQWMRRNAVNFFFTAFSVLLKKGTSWQVVRTSHLLDVFNSLFHCANSHVFLSFSCEFKKTLETECSEFLSEMRWKAAKKIIAYFLYFFASNAVNRCELFIFTAFLVLLKKDTSWQVVRISYLLDVFNSLFHCANSHVLLSCFLWI